MKVILFFATVLLAVCGFSLAQTCGGWGYYSTSNMVAPFEFGSDSNSEKAYGCQTPGFTGDIVAGVYTQSSGACRFAVGDSVVSSTTNVSVLCNPGGANLHFQPSEGLPQWGQSLVGGKIGEENLYVIRCSVAGGWISGYYRVSTGAAIGVANGVVVTCPTGSTQFLVCD